MMLAPILAAFVFLPATDPNIAGAVADLGSSESARREAASDALLRACQHNSEVLEAIAGSLEDPDPEVRWRVWRIARTLYPCGCCKGRGSIVDWWGVEYPDRYCSGRGSTWMPRRWLPDPPCLSCVGRGGTYWGDPRSLTWSPCGPCKGTGSRVTSPR